MISNPYVAERISDLMLDIGDRLNESVAGVMNDCPEDEFAKYRRAVGAIMAEVLLQVLNPIYKEHPSLKPEDFD